MTQTEMRTDGAAIHITNTAVDHLVARLLDRTQKERLYQVLSSQWDRHQASRAALRLLEHHGVEISSEEEEHLVGLREGELVQKVIAKIPTQSRDQFNAELQLVVYTAMQVRGSLEKGLPEEIAAALNTVVHTDVEASMLKMAVVQTGKEMGALSASQKTWVQASQERLSTLVRSQEDVMAVKKTHAAKQAFLRNVVAKHSDRARRTMGALIGHQIHEQLKAILAGWRSALRREKIESRLHEQYANRLQSVQDRLARCRVAKKKQAHAILERKATKIETEILRDIFDCWRDDTCEQSRQRAPGEQATRLSDQLAEFQAKQTSQAKHLMRQLAESTSSCLLASCFRTWQADVSRMKHERDRNEQLQAATARLAHIARRQSQAASGLVPLVLKSTDSGLCWVMLRTWARHLQDNRRLSNERAKALRASKNDLASFESMHAGTAAATMHKASMLIQATMLQRCFNAWNVQVRLAKTARQESKQIDGKKAQLKNVHSLFRAFALQLESRSKELQHSFQSPQKPTAKKLRKQKGSLSLPDIHSSPTGRAGGVLKEQGVRTPSTVASSCAADAEKDILS